MSDRSNCRGCDPATYWVFKILGRHPNLETWRTPSSWTNPCAVLTPHSYLKPRYPVFGLVQSPVLIRATGNPGYLSRHCERSRYNSCYLGWFHISGVFSSALLGMSQKLQIFSFGPRHNSTKQNPVLCGRGYLTITHRLLARL